MATKLKEMAAIFLIVFLSVALICVSVTLWIVVSYHRAIDARKEAAMQIEILGNKMELGDEVEQSRKKLIEIIDGNVEFNAVHAAHALGRVKDNSSDALDCLLRAMKRSEMKTLNKEAVQALAKIKPKREDIIDELMHQLDYETRDVSWFAADALGAIGRDAEKALPKLKEKMSSKDESLSLASSKAVERILKDITGTK